MNRRGFLGSILALGAAPAIVRAENIMRVTPRGWTRAASGLLVKRETGYGWEDGLNAEEIIRRDLAQQLARALDDAAMNGYLAITRELLFTRAEAIVRLDLAA